MDKNNNILSGVNCSVNECCYYGQGDKCTAKSIKVGGAHPSTSQDTECSTFKPENYMS